MKYIKTYESEPFTESKYRVGDIVYCISDSGHLYNDSYENSYQMLGKRVSNYLKVNDKYRV